MNKFLSHIEKKAATTGEVLRGMISPAWMENNVAKKHDKEGLKGVGANVKKHVTGTLRAAGRSIVESTAGLGIGAGAGKLVEVASRGKAKGAMAAGAAVGSLVGSYHGMGKSLANQADEAHDKYSDREKKAALEQLLEHGFDFDSAVEAIEKEAGFGAVRGMAGMVAGKAKSFATAVKADAGKLPGQAKSVMSGKTTLQGTRFQTKVSIPRTTALKEMVSNKASIAAAGGAGLGAAMASGKKKDE